MITDTITQTESKNIKIHSPRDLINILTAFYSNIKKAETQEIFSVVCLNANLEITALKIVSIGTLSNCLIHAREIFKAVIENNGHSFITVHNHPSGNTDPSEQDTQTYKEILKASFIMGLKLNDNIIISKTGYFSFKEYGLEEEIQNSIFENPYFEMYKN